MSGQTNTPSNAAVTFLPALRDSSRPLIGWITDRLSVMLPGTTDWTLRGQFELLRATTCASSR